VQFVDCDAASRPEVDDELAGSRLSPDVHGVPLERPIPPAREETRRLETLELARPRVDATSEDCTASSGFDPFQPEEYERLRRQSRRDAVRLGADPSVGEDALNTVLTNVIEGNKRPLSSAKYFRIYVISRIRDRNRSDRRLFAGGPGKRADAGLDARREEALRRMLPRLLQELSEGERAAVCAKIRGGLAASECGEEDVRAFERHWGIDLGIHNGTAKLSAATRTSPGTVASRAHRGERRLGEILARWRALARCRK